MFPPFPKSLPNVFLLGIGLLLVVIMLAPMSMGRPEIKIYDKYKDAAAHDQSTGLHMPPDHPAWKLGVHEEEAESLRMKLLERNEEESKSEKIVADVIALLESSEQDSSKDAVSTPDVALKIMDALTPRKNDLPAKCEPRLG